MTTDTKTPTPRQRLRGEGSYLTVAQAARELHALLAPTPPRVRWVFPPRKTARTTATRTA